MKETHKPKTRRKRASGAEGRPPRRRSGASNGNKASRHSRDNKRHTETNRDTARRNRSRKRQPRRRQRAGSASGKLQVLVLGSGGREHTLVWKLAQSPRVGKIFAFPGSSAISELGQCVTLKPENFRQNAKQLAQFASRNHIDLTVVGPEAPLAAGIVDEFKRRNLRIFGPTRAAAELEWSKIFAKEFMRRHNIPTGSFKVFSAPNDALTFCRTAKYPLVIKADGLAAGKGVLIVDNFTEAIAAVDDMMTRKRFGAAGKRILVEEFVSGREVSIMAFSDGEHCWPMIPSQDHKRIGEGDTGPNTGGMGAYAPAAFVTPELMATIQERILTPCINGMAAEGRSFKGVLYAGLMITEAGPKTLEFNCRFGDPETQVVLPLLESDLAEILVRIADYKPAVDLIRKNGRRKSKSAGKEAKRDDDNSNDVGPVYLRDLVGEYESVDEELAPEEKPEGFEISWSAGAAASVTLAARNYPAKPEVGVQVTGLDRRNRINQTSGLIFHAGTKKRNGSWITAGGRVLNVTGLGKDVAEALRNAYSAVDSIRFDGMQFRRDIGHQALQRRATADIEQASVE